jgi:hypothetical protein
MMQVTELFLDSYMNYLDVVSIDKEELQTMKNYSSGEYDLIAIVDYGIYFECKNNVPEFNTIKIKSICDNFYIFNIKLKQGIFMIEYKKPITLKSLENPKKRRKYTGHSVNLGMFFYQNTWWVVNKNMGI